MKKSLQTRCSLIYTLSVEFPANTKIDFLVQQILAVVQVKGSVSIEYSMQSRKYGTDSFTKNTLNCLLKPFT